MNGGTIYARGYMAWGAWVTTRANAELYDVDVITRGRDAFGIRVAGGNANAFPAGFTMNGGNIMVLDTSVYASGSVGSVGFYISDMAAAKLSNVDITTYGHGAVLSSGAHGVFVRGDLTTYITTLDMSQVSIKTNGMNSAGLMATARYSRTEQRLLPLVPVLTGFIHMVPALA